ncbi:MAG: pantoate--beta-alanine ligase [Bacteroidetes bacterium]|nr:MAG: pantoate--beta-alanine ligase [Bacteroidota bacterium]
MEIVRTKADLRARLAEHRAQGLSVALVPTMGALHEGHASLVQRAKSEDMDIIVVSVFVNPTQFNNPDDLRTYPRNEEADAKLLESLGVHYMFAPAVEEMYPEPDTRQFSFPPLDTVMEGANRPGHFNGVCQVVSKLFTIVEADRAYFGDKDYQQLCIVRALAKSMGIDTVVVGCPIIREEDGLAKSSRNQLLTPAHRAEASIIHRTLQTAGREFLRRGYDDTRRWVVEQIEASGLFKVEYFTQADASTLQELVNLERNPEGGITYTCKTGEGIETIQKPYMKGCIIGFIAVQAGQVRLIDNQRF